MTFSTTAPAGALAKAFAMATRVSPRAGSNIIPILANVRLAARGGKLTIAGTDMNAKIEISLDVEAKGKVTAPADKLAAITAKMDADKPVTLNQEESQLIVTQGRSRFTLPTLPSDDMALQMTGKVDAEFHIDAKGFSDALKAVEGAADIDRVREFLCGAYMDLKDDKPRLVAADGKRVGVATFEATAPRDAPCVIIPHDVFAIIHALAGQAETLTVAVTKYMAAFTAGGTRFETRVMEGEFPDWRRILQYAGVRDHKNPTLINVSAPILRRAMDKLAALGPTTLALTFGDQIEIEAQTSDTRQSKSGADDIIDREDMEGPGVRILVTSQGLAWAIGSIPGSSLLQIRLTGPLNGMLITDPARPDDVRLIMPLRG